MEITNPSEGHEKVLWRSDAARLLEIWSYSEGHGIIVLRSNKLNELLRLDITFGKLWGICILDKFMADTIIQISKPYIMPFIYLPEESYIKYYAFYLDEKPVGYIAATVIEIDYRQIPTKFQDYSGLSKDELEYLNPKKRSDLTKA